MRHLRENKRIYGALLAGLAGALAYLDMHEAAAVVGMLASGLFGAGAVKSDDEVKAEDGKT